MVRCNSCSYDGEDITIFNCPKCDEKIVRCAKCKTFSRTFQCKKCKFMGP